IIGHSAFMYTTFSSIILSNSIETIESGAFFETKSTYINIPQSVEIIGEAAYYKSNPPTELILPANLNVLEANVFSDSNIESIILPSNLSYLHYSAFSNSLNASNNYNKINSIKFASFKLSEENLVDFTNLFVYFTFRYGYQNTSPIQIVLPQNMTESAELQYAIETSLDIAKSIHNDFPEITFEFINSND
ncbi:MAG: leucine-rich repeat domain-containing protein, partial [Acholeplasmataceae bacterium]|nr:leucine-rich repeat domain-containing protein [Acholeplasmataceae bacterium]